MLKSFKSLPSPTGRLSTSTPPLEAEPAHRKLARLNREAADTVTLLQQLKKEWATKNIRAQATHTSIPTSEVSHVESQRRELTSQLQNIQSQIGILNRELRAKKAAGNGAKDVAKAAPARVGSKSKRCRLREHVEFPVYFALAARNELSEELFAQIERSAKSMLSQALKTGIEEP
jgi:hypothetical protein